MLIDSIDKDALAKQALVDKVRTLSAAVQPNDIPKAVVQILEIIIEMEPTALTWLPALFPGNPVIAAAVAAAPTLLPILQKIHDIFAAL